MKYSTEFQRVSQRTLYNRCMSHHNKDILFGGQFEMNTDYNKRAFERGFAGHTNMYDVRGDMYAAWCAGRDKRQNMQQAA